MSRKRSETLGVRTTNTTKRLARIAAEEAGVSVSRWAADAVRRQAVEQLRQPERPPGHDSARQEGHGE